MKTGVTISADSTSHRKLNYESRHTAHQVPNYKSPHLEIEPDTIPKVRLVGVNSTVDHTSETSFSGWMENLKEIQSTFERSPLRKRLGGNGFTVRLFAALLKGTHGDHANSENHVAKLIEIWKKDEALLGLDEEALLGLTPGDLIEYLVFWNQKKIAEVGGIEAWHALSPSQQAACDLALAKKFQRSLGEKEYQSLPGDEQRIIELFFWAGCCMHKDDNCFKAGNMAMMGWWDLSGNTAPIVLANKQNATLLRQILDPSQPDRPLDELELAAMQASTRGGAKTTALAGAVLNKKDDKKGQGDVCASMTSLSVKRFPDTNNTRFGSVGRAAEFLLVYLQPTRDFIEGIKNRKKKPGWTNIELNLSRALHDIPTLSELAVLALYAQSVTRPYMRFVRGPGTEQTNILDLGPFHRQVQYFVWSIIAEPDLLLGSDVSHTSATLDGAPWECPEAITTVHKLQPTFPHIQPLLIAFFFEGSLPAFYTSFKHSTMSER